VAEAEDAVAAAPAAAARRCWTLFLLADKFEHRKRAAP
jgi:hypothetical protein